MTGRTAGAGLRTAPRSTPKLGAYTALAGLGLLAALVAGRPELVALAAPFASVLVAGFSLAGKPDVKALFDRDHGRQVQGETVEVELELRTQRPLSRLELLLDVPDGLGAETPNPQLISLSADERRTIDHTLRCERWEAYVVGDLLLRSQDPFGLLVHEWAIERKLPLRGYPHGETLRRLLRPRASQAV